MILSIRRSRLVALAVVLTSSAMVGCSDDPSAPDPDPILGDWQAVSFVIGGANDLIAGGMSLGLTLSDNGTYRFDVTNDMLDICSTPGADCSETGSFVYTSTSVTIDDDQIEDAATFTYTISGSTMTWTGQIETSAVAISLARN